MFNEFQVNKAKKIIQMKKDICELMRSSAQSKFCFIFTSFNKSLLETDIANAQQQPDCINDWYTYAIIEICSD